MNEEETDLKKSKAALAYEIMMAILAVISVITIWSTHEYVNTIDLVIWLFFVMDVTIRFIKTEQKKEYIKKYPLDIIAIIPLDSIFRLARIARLFRVLRALAILNHYFKPVYAILRTNNLDKVIVVLFVVIFISAIPIRIIEPSIVTYTDAVWWAIVTATTVGYGDISPETVVGRLIAIILMVFGIGLIGLVTSSVATYFLKGNDEENNPTVEYIKKELDRVEELTDLEIERLRLLLETFKKDERV